MGGIRDETLHPLLGVGARLKSMLVLGEHGVKRTLQGANLRVT